MKLRITQSGFETYNGQMGLAFFENGLSVDDVPELVAKRLAGVVQCEWEDGSNPSVTQAELTRDIAAPNVYTTIADTAAANIETLKAPQPKESVTEAPVAKVETAPVSTAGPVYTQEELEAIADSKGIAGLRAIAEPKGIKSNSISGLIKELVAAGVQKA